MSLNFSKDFLFGFSMSGFQFEMGIEGSEDRNSDWWVWTHNLDNIASGLVSGDLPERGPGYWHLYRIDHDIADKMGLNIARVGIEWSRIFPKPTYNVRVDVERDEDGNIVYIDINESTVRKLDELANKKAVIHYREILNDWRRRGKAVILNLNHFTLPLWIHDPVSFRLNPEVSKVPAGWLNERTVIEFSKYAAYIAWVFDDLVDYWSTMNEPNAYYYEGFINVKSGFPPGIPSIKYALRAAHNLIQAHARAYDAIKNFSKKPVGIIYVFTWVEPLGRDLTEAIRLANHELNYMFLDAIIKGRTKLSIYGKENITVDRGDLKGRIDWLGLNYYTRTVIVSDNILNYRPAEGYGSRCLPNIKSKDGRDVSDSGWEVYPEGLYYILRDVYNRYELPIIVTENGIADSRDNLRPKFIVQHLMMIHKAMCEGIDVRGYLIWSLTDNYEWSKGFKMRFGLVHVDYESKSRYLRYSSVIYHQIAFTKTLPKELIEKYS